MRQKYAYFPTGRSAGVDAFKSGGRILLVDRIDAPTPGLRQAAWGCDKPLRLRPDGAGSQAAATQKSCNTETSSDLHAWIGARGNWFAPTDCQLRLSRADDRSQTLVKAARKLTL
jgi:hypothetical protein